LEPATAATPVAASAVPAKESRSAAPEATLQSAGSSGDASSASVNTVTALAPAITPVETTRRLVVLSSKMSMPVHISRSDLYTAPEPPAAVGDEPASAVPQLNGEAPGSANELLSGTVPKLPPPPPPVAENAGNPAAPLTPARLISSVQPVYPSLAKQAHIEGNVIIEARIDASGKVVGMIVLSGSSVLREAAREALAKWNFQPAQRGDQPTPSSVVVTVRFKLK
jgi:periplasmic protein TonB